MTSLEPRRPLGLDGLAGSSSRSVLPAWKREILERKRAKLASLGAGPRGLTGGADAGAGVQAAAGTTAGAGGECPGEPAPPAERLVLADSLGPLRENPFMRLETERKRQRRGRGAASGARPSTGRPVQQLLELYSRVPGIRTIRADNILIIESEPGFLPGQRPYEVNTVGPSPDPMQQLLARRGCSVAEIRAAEVVIYETPRAAAEAAAQPGRVSRLLEKFDPPIASGETRPQAPSPPRRRGSPERSRPLVPKPSAVEHRSSATSPSLPSPGPRTPSVGERAAWFQREQILAAAPSRLSDFLQKTGSNSFTVHPRGLARGGRTVPNGPAIEATPDPHLGPANGLPAVGAPVPSSSSTSKGTDNRKPNADEEAPILHPSPGPCPMGSANGGPSATPAAPSTFPKNSLASATPSQRRWVFAATSTNDSFEIRPAPKPDMETISDEDVQAKALANLRMNSKNSFVFIPKPRVEGSRAGHPVGSKAFEQPKGKGSVSSQSGHKTHIPLENGGQHPQEVVPAYRNHLGGEAQQAAEERDPQKQVATALSEVNHKWQGEVLRPRSIERPSKQEPSGGFEISDTSLSSSVTQIPEQPGRPGLPVTYIDEVDSDDESYQEAKPASKFPDTPHYRPHPSLPNGKSEVHYLSNNTFTVVPNRKPAASPEVSLSPPNGELYAEEEEKEDPWKGKTLEDPEASHETVGIILKKRYPTVHEIEVIGGYLSLKKSCLTKIGSSRKKMKISFNEKSLHTTFEYPSESSLVEEEEAEEEEEGASGSEGDEEEKPFAVFLPRATLVNSTVMESAARPPESGSGLSSYTPKHSVEFSKWQEQKYDAGSCEAGASPQKEVMLTPASQNDLSDFRSEPALYF